MSTFAERYGPWALVLGGSEGVGAAFARKLAARGIKLTLVARNAGALDALAAELRREHGVEVRTLSQDLTQAGAAANIMAMTADVEVGLLVCNAGAAHGVADLLDAEPEAGRRMIALNVATPVELVHHYAGAMRRRRRGGLILVGSMAGYCGGPGIAVYAAAKAFLRIFAEGLWLELQPHGVHVLGLVLGATRTPAMLRAGFDLDRAGHAVADPEAVAQEGLGHLADGPIHVAAGLAAAAQAIAAGPRAEVVRAMNEATRLLARGSG
jgi:short-subunit dehydrogenase